MVVENIRLVYRLQAPVGGTYSGPLYFPPSRSLSRGLCTSTSAMTHRTPIQTTYRIVEILSKAYGVATIDMELPTVKSLLIFPPSVCRTVFRITSPVWVFSVTTSSHTPSDTCVATTCPMAP